MQDEGEVAIYFNNDESDKITMDYPFESLLEQLGVLTLKDVESGWSHNRRRLTSRGLIILFSASLPLVVA